MTSKKLLDMLRKHHITYRPEEFGTLIGRIIEHAKTVRKEGILKIEQDIQDEKNYLYRKLMGMALDGVDGEVVKRVGDTYIRNVESYLEARQKEIKVGEGDVERLIRQMRMVVEAVHMIQNGFVPYLIEEMLFMYVLGEARPASRFKQGDAL